MCLLCKMICMAVKAENLKQIQDEMRMIFVILCCQPDKLLKSFKTLLRGAGSNLPGRQVKVKS